MDENKAEYPEFSQYVMQLLEEKKWSMRELARRAGVSHAIVAMQLSGYGKVSHNLCEKIAPPLGVSVNKLKRLAGLGIPPPQDPKVIELVEIAEMLSPTKQEVLLKMAIFLQGTEFEFESPTSNETNQPSS